MQGRVRAWAGQERSVYNFFELKGHHERTALWKASMTEKNPSQEDHRNRNDFLKDIHGKSDRAVAIIGASLLNAQIEQLLTVFFVQDEAEIEALLGGDRPSGNFGVRLRLAYLLGLISLEEHVDLAAVNRISEAFSRELEEISFDDLPIRAWCLDLSLPNKIMLSGEQRRPRQLYVFTVALLLRQIALRIQNAERSRREPPAPFSLVNSRR